jgi:predicted esterase
MGGTEAAHHRGRAASGKTFVTTAIPPHGGQPVQRAGVAIENARAAVIMVHGRGAGPANILSLVPLMHQPAVTFIAPAASGNTWYPKSFMAPTDENEPGISSGISVVHALIDEVRQAGVPAERILLLGFSQGACLTSTAAQRRPARYGGIILFSGGLIGPPGTRWDETGSFDGTPVFLGCSDTDSHVPEDRVRESAAVFERMGASVTTRIYPGMGHLVNDDEAGFARDLLATLAT